jgi:hypothetical protein
MFPHDFILLTMGVRTVQESCWKGFMHTTRNDIYMAPSWSGVRHGNLFGIGDGYLRYSVWREAFQNVSSGENSISGTVWHKMDF